MFTVNEEFIGEDRENMNKPSSSIDIPLSEQLKVHYVTFYNN